MVSSIVQRRTHFAHAPHGPPALPSPWFALPFVSIIHRCGCSLFFSSFVCSWSSVSSQGTIRGCRLKQKKKAFQFASQPAPPQEERFGSEPTHILDSQDKWMMLGLGFPAKEERGKRGRRKCEWNLHTADPFRFCFCFAFLSLWKGSPYALTDTDLPYRSRE